MPYQTNGPWYASEEERRRVQELAERDRKKRERQQELQNAPSTWQRIRGLLEPETGRGTAGLIGASLVPGVGEAIDAADFAAGFQDRDLSRMGWAAGGLLVPLVAGSTLRKVGEKIVGYPVKKGDHLSYGDNKTHYRTETPHPYLHSQGIDFQKLTDAELEDYFEGMSQSELDYLGFESVKDLIDAVSTQR